MLQTKQEIELDKELQHLYKMRLAAYRNLEGIKEQIHQVKVGLLREYYKSPYEERPDNV